MSLVEGKSFSIHGKGLKLDTKADIEPYLDALRAVPDLEKVKFGGNTLGVDACSALAPVLKSLKRLKVADFADIFTGRLITEIPQALQSLCDALEKIDSLEEVDLSDNAFGGRSADPMVSFLTNHRNLRVLRLTNNGLGPIGGEIVANALAASGRLALASGRKSTLQRVICGRNRLEKGSAPAWAAAYQAHGTLLEVRMFGNDIKHEGIDSLIGGLSHCKGLQHLDLQDNTLSESGSQAVAQAINSWRDLRILNISNCLMTPLGGVVLATVLAKGITPKLEILKLQYNELDRRSLTVLARAIADHLPHLRVLELNGNRADPEDACVEDIRSALSGHGHDNALDKIDDVEEFEEEDEHPEEEHDQGKETEKGEDATIDALTDVLSRTSLG